MGTVPIHGLQDKESQPSAHHSLLPFPKGGPRLGHSLHIAGAGPRGGEEQIVGAGAPIMVVHRSVNQRGRGTENQSARGAVYLPSRGPVTLHFNLAGEEAGVVSRPRKPA